MTEEDRKNIIDSSWDAHAIIESNYLDNPAIKGGDLWLEKQRHLLADMAIHLLQTSLNSGEINKDKLSNNIYSILTIADQFLPEAELAKAKDKLF